MFKKNVVEIDKGILLNICRELIEINKRLLAIIDDIHEIVKGD